MVRSLVSEFADCRLFVSHRSEAVSEQLCRTYSQVERGDNQWVLDHSDYVVLSVLAAVAREILPNLEFRADQTIISVMADIDLAEVSTLIAPAVDPCVTIPLPFIATGGCPLPVFPKSPALEKLFGRSNPVITVAKEMDIGPHFAATAILSTLMAQLNLTSSWLGNLTGNRTDGEIYVASLVSGYLDALDKDGMERFVEAMQDLSTEGGLNTQLLNHNLDSGMLETLERGLNGLHKRLNG